MDRRGWHVTSKLLAYACLILLATFVSALSQVILKKAALKTYPSKVAEYLNFPVIFAYAIFVGTTLLTIIAYRVVPLSFGPVLEATSYLYITAFGAIFFKERVTAKKLLALALIVGGICVYALGL